MQFPVIYAKATDGRAGPTPAELGPDLTLLFDTILDTIPAPLVDPDGPTQLLITALEYSSYVGKIAVGRLHAGRLKAGQAVARIMPQQQPQQLQMKLTPSRTLSAVWASPAAWHSARMSSASALSIASANP